MMFLANILCLIGGIALGVLTVFRIVEICCIEGIMKIEFYNPKTGELKDVGSIEPERYK